MSDKKPRAKRSDKGSFRFTPKDQYLLTWIHEQYAISKTHLKILAGRVTGEGRVKKAGVVSDAEIARITNRWFRHNLIKRQRFTWYAKGKEHSDTYYWLTKRAVRLTGTRFHYKLPALNRLVHIDNVNLVRLYLEVKEQDATWVSERSIRKDTEEKKRHLADGELHYIDGDIAGIEVELSKKPRDRLKKIFRTLKQTYDYVYYFLPNRKGHYSYYEELLLERNKAYSEDFFSITTLPNPDDL